MSEFLSIVLAVATVNHVVLNHGVGIYPDLSTQQNISRYFTIAFASAFFVTVAVPLVYVIQNWLLEPLQLGHLNWLVFSICVLLLGLLVQSVIERKYPELSSSPPMELILVLSNCAVLYSALLGLELMTTIYGALAYGMGSGLGFALFLCAFAFLRERIDESTLPKLTRGPVISLITTGSLALALMGFTGVVSL